MEDISIINQAPSVVILYSGGADSRLMLEFALQCNHKPYCILIDYGQLHKQELEFAKKQLDDLFIRYHQINISNLNVNSGLTGSGEKNESGAVHNMHVPGRNTIFLSLAFSVAESLNIDKIWIGSDWDDRLNLFPDCYQEFIISVNELFKQAGPKSIKVEAPLLGLSKENIIKLLISNNIEENEVYSGYGDL